MKTIHIGLIGTGFAATLHADSYKSVAGINVKIKACASIEAGAQEFADKYGIEKVYADYKEMLKDETIDVIDICVPVKLHIPMIIDALKAGKHVISEKPLTGYCGFESDEKPIGLKVSKKKMYDNVLKQIEELKEVVDSSDKLFMYAENWVYSPTILKNAEILKKRKSRILYMRGEESHSGSHAYHAANWSITGGGAIIRMGCHPLSAVLYLKNEEAKAHGEEIKVQSVVADAGVITSKLTDNEKKFIQANPVDVEDWGIMNLTFTDGTKASVIAGDMIVGGVKNYLEMYNNDSVLISNMTPNNTMLSYFSDNNALDDIYITEKVGNKQGWQFVCHSEEFERGYIGEMQDFMECVAYDRKPLSSFDLAYETIKVIYAAYLSYEQGKRIEVNNS